MSLSLNEKISLGIQILTLDQDFELKVYVTDEFWTKWISEHGGQIHEYTTEVQGQSVKNRSVNTWSYRTEQKAW